VNPKVFIALIVFLIVLGGGYYSVEYALPYSPIKPHLVKKKDLSSDVVLKFSQLLGKYPSRQFETIVSNSIALRCILLTPTTNEKTKGTIIVLHGIADRKESMAHQAASLLENNYSVILLDLRAHGESGGNYCTFGYYEKYDVSKVITAALSQFGDLEPIGIFGNSLGAAVSLQAMEIDKRITCGVVESSFANLRETVYDYMQRIMFVRIEWAADYALKRSEQIAQFEVDSVRPELSARNISAPVLVIHGGQDKNISIDYGKRIFANLHSSQKEFYRVAGANHYNIAQIGGEQLNGKIISFFNTHFH